MYLLVLVHLNFLPKVWGVLILSHSPPLIERDGVFLGNTKNFYSFVPKPFYFIERVIVFQ